VSRYYVLRRTDQRGGYVAPPGSERAYTQDRNKARRFPTREAAETDRCVENEVIEPVDD
jgi:hypothetical protein